MKPKGMTDREILEECINSIVAKFLEFYKDNNVSQDMERIIRDKSEEALTQLRAYYREKIKRVLPKKKEIPDWNKAIPNPTDYQRGLQQGLFDGLMDFNRAIDAILKEIDKEMS